MMERNMNLTFPNMDYLLTARRTSIADCWAMFFNGYISATPLCQNQTMRRNLPQGHLGCPVTAEEAAEIGRADSTAGASSASAR